MRVCVRVRVRACVGSWIRTTAALIRVNCLQPDGRRQVDEEAFDPSLMQQTRISDSDDRLG